MPWYPGLSMLSAVAMHYSLLLSISCKFDFSFCRLRCGVWVHGSAPATLVTGDTTHRLSLFCRSNQRDNWVWGGSWSGERQLPLSSILLIGSLTIIALTAGQVGKECFSCCIQRLVSAFWAPHLVRSDGMMQLGLPYHGWNVCKNCLLVTQKMKSRNCSLVHQILLWIMPHGIVIF